MSHLQEIQPRFVEVIPKDREDGVLYISITYGTMVHNCACGCGSKITTPLGPARWRLTYDGETVSVRPSVGNWSFPCRSHYVIDHNRIKWAPRWSQQKITSGRSHDRFEKTRHAAAKAKGERFVARDEEALVLPEQRGLLRRLFHL